VEVKPLFIPLKTKFFEQFVAGVKDTEYRRYGPRWNERTCFVGRPVTLSKGYGKYERRRGVVTGFRVVNAWSKDAEACFGKRRVPLAAITISTSPRRRPAP
jgi:hypothetical protein